MVLTQVELGRCVGWFKAMGKNTEIPTYVQDILQTFQHSSIQEVDLSWIRKPPKMDIPITSDGGPRGIPTVSKLTRQLSAIKGEHWDGIIERMLSPVHMHN